MDVETIGSAVKGVFTILCFRSLPVVFWAALAGRMRLGTRLLVACLSAVPVVAAHVYGLFSVGWLAGAYVYYGAVAALTPSLATLLRARGITRGAVFVACTSAFLLFPSIVLPPTNNALALVIGWDLVLSSYSYVVEASKKTPGPSLRECMFFLLVNPSLVFTRRGERVDLPGFNARGGARVLLGFVTLLGALAALAPATGWLKDRALLSGRSSSDMVGFVVLLFVTEYARHSGLASLQIGMIRQLGYVVPERYEYPLLARSPIDFWRRWNTYVGTWMLHYVFWPLALRLGRAGGALASLAKPIAVLATFIAVGLVHFEQLYLRTFHADARSVVAFGASGLLVVAYAAVGEAALRARSAPRIWLSNLVGRSALWATTLCLFAWWLG